MCTDRTNKKHAFIETAMFFFHLGMGNYHLQGTTTGAYVLSVYHTSYNSIFKWVTYFIV